MQPIIQDDLDIIFTQNNFGCCLHSIVALDRADHHLLALGGAWFTPNKSLGHGGGVLVHPESMGIINMSQYDSYPPVNSHIAIENHNFLWVGKSTISMAINSIANC